MNTNPDATYPFDRVQAGYLVLKLLGEALVTKDEARSSLSRLFPEVLPLSAEAVGGG